MPTQDTLVLERFFDESGGMQLVLHAPFGSRVNKAWGLALRKRFCRQFNFELQAAATDEALLLSLGPQHSFPLADVFRYLHPATARDVLVQAFLDAPVFQTRWRWNTTISLAVPRNRGGKKVPPQLQRMLADDLMAAVFPDAAACLENIPGDRQIPDHPLVGADGPRLPRGGDGLRRAGRACSTRIHRGELRLVSRDTPEPSPLAHEILNARPYAFLDDAPLEERRTQAVYARRASEASSADDLGALDAAAIERVRDEARPDPRDADELHDALLDGRLSHARRSGRRCRGARRAVRAACVDNGPRRDPGYRLQPQPHGTSSLDLQRQLVSGSPPSGCPRSSPSIPARRSHGQRGASARARRARLDARGGDRRAPARPADDRRADDGRSARRRPVAISESDADAALLALESDEGVDPARSRSTASDGPTARMVRSPAARAHSPLHAEPAARRDRAGQPGRFHAVPLRVAARRAVEPPDRPRRTAGHRRHARRLRAGRDRVGARGPARAHRSLRSGRCSTCCA